MRDGAAAEFDAFPPSLCYGATSLPAISSKTFIRLLPPSGIRRDESAAVALWRDKKEKYEHTVKHAGHLPD
jgi:hypothetical protein